MILPRSVPWGEEDWKTILREAVRTVSELRAILGLSEDELDWLEPKDFEVLVPRPFLARMHTGDPEDPLLLQVAPLQQENVSPAHYSENPLQESEFVVKEGVLKKYANRVLVITTAACPVHCRYCFRRHFDYRSNQLKSQDSLLHVVRSDQTINEVILSGGDPLTLSDQSLGELIHELELIDHVRTLRIHTRFPIVVPQRMTNQLLQRFAKTSLNVVVVIHANHPQEIDYDVSVALEALSSAGVRIFNQSVLLNGVNDSATVLTQLSRQLFDYGVTPYYLHMLDPVAGSAGFEVDEVSALQIFEQTRNQLPGYLVPKLVRETPHEKAKTLVQA